MINLKTRDGDPELTLHWVRVTGRTPLQDQHAIKASQVDGHEA